jgi:type I restriction enzyme R subunit
MRQYRFDRDPKEPLLAFRRCLARFAVDPDLGYVTTHLAGTQTRFLPLNQGKFGGVGNPLGHGALARGPVPGQCGPRRALEAEGKCV